MTGSDLAGSGTIAARRAGRADPRRAGPRPLLWMAPLLLVVGVFYLYPAVEVLRLSLTDSTLQGTDARYTTGTLSGVLGSASLPGVVWTTTLFVVGTVTLQLLTGLAIALVVQRAVRRRLRGSIAVRTLVLSAWIMPGIVIGLIWQLLLSESSQGLINAILGLGGVGPVAFLSDPELALISVTLANVWRGTGFSMLLQYAGLQSIDPTLYEASSIDGASGWQAFRYVTLPLLRPFIMVNLIFISIATVNTFDMILSLTGGGPGRATEVLVLRAYNVIFQQFELAQGAVLAILMLVFSLALTLVYLRVLRTERT
jgi:multiple sugar transport system permease protein